MGSGTVLDTTLAARRVYGSPVFGMVESDGLLDVVGMVAEGGGWEGVAGCGGGGVMVVEKMRRGWPLTRDGRLAVAAAGGAASVDNFITHATGVGRERAVRC